jgi:hypothetical protein
MGKLFGTAARKLSLQTIENISSVIVTGYTEALMLDPKIGHSLVSQITLSQTEVLQ